MPHPCEFFEQGWAPRLCQAGLSRTGTPIAGRLVPALLLYGVNSHLRALTAAIGDSEEEAMRVFFLASEIAGGASAQRGWNFGDEVIVIGVLHLENVNETLASGHINALVLSIKIKVVGILGAGQCCNHAT